MAALWRPLLSASLDSNSHLKHASYFQLATVKPDGKPANRTVVFRGFAEGTDKLQFTTDSRTHKGMEKFYGLKLLHQWLCFDDEARQFSIVWYNIVMHMTNDYQIEEINHCPYGEICWYFTGSWEQFRIQGKLDIIGEKDMDPVSCLLREKVWFASSLRSRLQYLGPHPCIALSNNEDVKTSLDPCTGPVGTFCLLTLDPDQVDYLNLKSNRRIVFKRLGGDVDGNCQWMQQEVNP